MTSVTTKDERSDGRPSMRSGCRYRAMSHSEESEPWVGDEPLTHRSDDRLGRFDFASDAADTIRRLTVRGDSSVIALIGPWGAGKSTVLEYIQADLRSSKDGNAWTVVAFNPWFYQDLTSLQRDCCTDR